MKFSYIVTLCNSGGKDFDDKLKIMPEVLGRLPRDIEFIFPEQIMNEDYPTYQDNLKFPADMNVNFI